MLTVTYLRENKEKALKGLSKRNFTDTQLVQEAIDKDDLRKTTQHQLDEVLAESNQLSKQIGELYKANKKDEANAIKDKTASLKESSKQLEQKLRDTKNELNEILYQIPNIPNEKVVAGTTEADNETVYENQIEKRASTGLLPHWEIAQKYKLIDFEAGVKITGAGFPLYRGKGAKLQRALIQFFLDRNTEAGYEEVIPPFVVNEASALGTGQLPDKEGQMYYVNEDDLYLIPTSEVPVTNIYRGELLNTNDLPIKLTAYSPCFRREAGSYGKDVRGLNRLHQFEKVEIVRIEKPEQSYAALDEMIEQVKSLMEDLELSFRVLRLCGGDTGFAAAITYDFEVWSAAQERWLEVSSVSNFESFQAHRLQLRLRSDKGSELCHTLNGSAMALPRIMAALMETHQYDQKIKIPKKLIPYTGFEVIE